MLPFSVSRSAPVTNTTVGRQTSNLPTELLSRIFLMIRNEEGIQITSLGLPHWIHITWVCQRWRQVANTTLALWTDIHLLNLKNPPWLPTFLERAKRMPLNITLSHNMQYYDKETFDLLVRSVGSFRYLELEETAPFGKERSLVPHLPQMHKLEVLKLGDEDAVDPRLLSSTLADLGLTREHCPHLHTLALRGTFFPWTSSIYHSLRELILTYINPLPPAHALLQVLRSCPDLEIMQWTNTLQDVPVFGPTDDVPRLSHVALPHLQKIVIDDIHTRTRLLCEHIVVPSTCNVFVYPKGHRLNDSLSAISLRHPIFSTIIAHCTHLHMSIGTQHFHLAAGRCPIPPPLCALSTIHIEILVTDGPIRDPLPYLTPWRDLLDPFTSTDGRESLVTSFSLRYNNLRAMSPMMWQTRLARLPHLKELIVEEHEFGPGALVSRHHKRKVRLNTFKSLFAALSGGPDPLDDGKEAEPPCGARLRRVVWRVMVIDSAALLALECMLDMRAARGVPLEELVFENCYCARDTSTLAVLSLLAPHVEVGI